MDVSLYVPIKNLKQKKVAQWLSDRVLDSRLRAEFHRRHCVVVLEQDTFILA